jgi:radical SAM protein with 4Fe4S-binding SPASM domain
LYPGFLFYCGVTRAVITDGIQYVRKLNVNRVWNAFKVVASYFVSKWTKKPIQWGYPISISIEPTTSCNLRCPECPSGLREFTRPTGMLEINTHDKILKELSPTLTYITYYFQGEPYLNPQFLNMVSKAHEKNIYTATSTNAHYLTQTVAEQTVESGLSRVIISIDGVDQDAYGKYRIGGKLTKVLEGTRNLVNAKRKLGKPHPHIIWQFIAFDHNLHQVEEVKKLGREYGVDEVKIKTAQVYDFEKGSDLIPKDGKYARYEFKNGRIKFKNRLLNHCWRLWHSCVVTWDGQIVPCCFDKDGKHVLGDNNLQEFAKIWNGTEYKRFRNLILKSRKNIDICKNCTEGTKVWA